MGDNIASKASGSPPDERRCTARSKQRNARCNAWALPGKGVCYYHGGATTAPRGKASPHWKHGERSRETEERRDFAAEVIAKAKVIEADMGRTRIIGNAAERAVRRETVAAGVDADLDIVGKLDEADRRDVQTLAQLEALRRAAETPTAPQTTINVLGEGAVCVIAVRLPNGDRARAVEPRTIDGESVGLLVEGPDGAWYPSRLVVRDGLEVAERVVLALPEGQP
jgi:hypothetical protein